MPELQDITWMWICFGLAALLVLVAAWPASPQPREPELDEYGYPLLED